MPTTSTAPPKGSRARRAAWAGKWWSREMAGKGKRLKQAYAAIDRNAFYSLDDAVKMIKERAVAKFDETIEIALNLGIDPRHPDQNVRGGVLLPHGTGKRLRVAVA